VKRLVGLILVATASIAAADSFYWMAAEKGVFHKSGIAFGGCAPADSLTDEKAKNAATIRARANIAKSRSLSVSGEERLATFQSGDTRYSATVTESTSAPVRPIKIVEEKLEMIDGVSNICVLIVEN